MKAVIQSGGKGTRLRPYTMVLPKPLMPIGAKPALELLLKWLRRHGTHHAYITTGYLGHLIRSYCGDGGQWDLQISYTEETEPLGTMGALSLLRNELDDTFLMLNGDVLTDLNINDLIADHRQSGAALTIATSRRDIKIAFGIIDQKDGWVTRFKEKPVLAHHVSMGVYCIDPSILKLIPNGVAFGFDDMMYRLLEKGLPIRSFVHDGLWLDIGNVDDFHKAQEMTWDDPPTFETAPMQFDNLIVS